jgi:hypothetical protein
MNPEEQWKQIQHILKRGATKAFPKKSDRQQISLITPTIHDNITIKLRNARRKKLETISPNK